MKSWISAAAVLLLGSASIVLAAPTSTVEKRASVCGQWDTVTTGSFIVYQDLWGESSGTGSQCSSVKSASGNSISWSTDWSWSGGSSQVKSYADVQLSSFKAGLVSSFSSIPTSWSWTYTGSNLVADVSYDIFLGTAATGTAKYEIMIWLAALGGAGPISSTGSPVATPTIDGHSWKLYSGPNGATTVYSFVATSTVNSFSGNIVDFLKYLETSFGVSSALYLQSISSGTEAFTGSNAVFTTSSYSLST